MSVSSYLFAYGLLLTSGVIILRLIVRRDYLRRGELSLVAAMLQALLFFAYGGFPYFYLPGDWPATHVNRFVHLFGLVAIIVGLGGLFYGMIVLGLLPSIGRGRNRLAQSGIYRKSRNPQALACGLYVLGFTVLWPSWYALGWAILYAILIHIMIITEEEHLLRAHGEGYVKYGRDVPRYFSLRSWNSPETTI
ncbi:MAG TPA: methyltransferase [Anaerolineae bacterium]|nr:methyltransferase [Anaerolineae bacterium]